MATQHSACVVFVHGLAKKPPRDKLHEIWLWALGRDNPMPKVFAAPNLGLRLHDEGIPTRFTYYADVFYGEAFEADIRSYYESNDQLELAVEALDRFEADLQPPSPRSEHERRFLAGFEARLRRHPALSSPGAPLEPVTAAGAQLEIASWLPDSTKQSIIKKAAMEAYYYLFDQPYVRADSKRFQVKQELRARLLSDLAQAAQNAERIVVIAHSMGTMLAYDVLRNCPEAPAVSTLITIGSPLGVTEVQDELTAPGSTRVDFPAAKVGQWINIFDPLDPVCGADPRIGNDFSSVAGKRVLDVKESNWGRWRHTSTHYLAGSALRTQLASAVGIA